MASPLPYRGQRIALLTRHGKERVLGPVFAEKIGAELVLTTAFDTDRLGTFTRDVARAGDQLEAARAKATKAMELLGLPCAVASEGAFGPDRFGLFPWNVELVVLVDRERGIELVGHAEGPAFHVHEHVSTHHALAALAKRARFPEHGLVLRPDDRDDPRIAKGLVDHEALHAAFDAALSAARSAKVFVESDLRAHLNPTRMAIIRRAAEDLAARIASACPRCGTPGFWAVERIPGLSCRDCGAPTSVAHAERWSCIASDHAEVRSLGADRQADPRECSICNP